MRGFILQAGLGRCQTRLQVGEDLAYHRLGYNSFFWPQPWPSNHLTNQAPTPCTSSRANYRAIDAFASQSVDLRRLAAVVAPRPSQRAFWLMNTDVIAHPCPYAPWRMGAMCMRPRRHRARNR